MDGFELLIIFCMQASKMQTLMVDNQNKSIIIINLLFQTIVHMDIKKIYIKHIL